MIPDEPLQVKIDHTYVQYYVYPRIRTCTYSTYTYVVPSPQYYINRVLQVEYQPQPECIVCSETHPSKRETTILLFVILKSEHSKLHMLYIVTHDSNYHQYLLQNVSNMKPIIPKSFLGTPQTIVIQTPGRWGEQLNIPPCLDMGGGIKNIFTSPHAPMFWAI